MSQNFGGFSLEVLFRLNFKIGTLLIESILLDWKLSQRTSLYQKNALTLEMMHDYIHQTLAIIINVKTICYHIYSSQATIFYFSDSTFFSQISYIWDAEMNSFDGSLFYLWTIVLSHVRTESQDTQIWGLM